LKLKKSLIAFSKITDQNCERIRIKGWKFWFSRRRKYCDLWHLHSRHFPI